MSAKLLTIEYSAETGNGLVTAVDDARFYNAVFAKSGFVEGCTASLVGGNQIHIDDGWGVAFGRIFAIEGETVNAAVSTSGTRRGRVYVHIDVASEIIEIRSVAAASLPALVQENINDNGTIFELAICEYDISQVSASNLSDARVMANGLADPLYKCTLLADAWQSYQGGYVQVVPCTPINGGAPMTASTMTDSPMFNATQIPATNEELAETLRTILLGVRIPGAGTMSFGVASIPSTDIELFMRGMV